MQPATRVFLKMKKILLEWEAKQNEITEKENAMLQKTKVNFHSMDSEVTV